MGLKIKVDWNNYRIKVIYIVAAFIFAFIFFSFCYGDTYSIIRYELSFADSILHGEFSQFYKRAYDTMQQINPSHSPAYDLPMNFLLGIWGIPLYFYIKLRKIIDIRTSFICLAYGKSLMLLSTVLASYMIYKVCESLDVSKKRSLWGSFGFLTSLLTLTCTGIIGQSDIIGMVPTLAGLNAYIRKDNKKFLLWFIIAFPFKQYALFVFIPLLLLREKNIIKVGLQTIMVFGFTFIANMPIKNYAPAYEFKRQFSQELFNGLLGGTLPVVNGISSTVFLWGIVCLYCYLHKEDVDKEKYNANIVFVSLAAMIAVFIGFNANCYWYVNMAPYLVITIIFNVNESNRLIIFETLGMLALTVINIVKNYWCYDVQNCENMFLCRLFGNKVFDSSITIESVVEKFQLPMFASVFGAIYVICMIAMVCLSYPKHRRDDFIDTISFENSLVLRAIINIGISFIPVLLYITGII